MSKILSVLVAGLIAGSAFATDVTAATVPVGAPAATTQAPVAKAPAKKVHKHVKKAAAKKNDVKKDEKVVATPATPAKPAAPAAATTK